MSAALESRLMCDFTEQMHGSAGIAGVTAKHLGSMNSSQEAEPSDAPPRKSCVMQERCASAGKFPNKATRM